MYKLFILFFGSILSIGSLQAQDTFSGKEKEIIKVIQQLFEGMRKGDSSLVHQTFHETARLQTTYTHAKTSKPMIHTEAGIQQFLQQVGTPHDEVYDERIQEYKVFIDDNMASVWTPYKFYVGDSFSHCGVNSFLLFKSEEGWKITFIMDTRRKKECK